MNLFPIRKQSISLHEKNSIFCFFKRVYTPSSVNASLSHKSVELCAHFLPFIYCRVCEIKKREEKWRKEKEKEDEKKKRKEK